MSRLVVVRHAQASLLESNYDKLSLLGEKQAQLLGKYWTAQNLQFDRVATGPRVRQQHTAAIVAEAYEKAGLPFPLASSIPEFDEYDGEGVYFRALPGLLETNEEVRALHQSFKSALAAPDRIKCFQKLFERIIARWVSGEIVVPDVESWPEFCARVNRGISRFISHCAHGEIAAIFCSGGPIAVAVQRSLNLSPRDTLRVMWMSCNASYSEFLFSGDCFTLSAFNSFPHLDRPSLLTYW